MIVILCVLFAPCKAETVPYQETRFLNKLKKHFSAAAHIDEGAKLEQTIQNDVFYERFDDLEVRVAHISADVDCLIAEVVVSCDTEDVILKTWEDPVHDTIDNLNNAGDQTIYYINADFLTSCEAWDDEPFDHGISLIISQIRPFQLEGRISEEIIVRVGSVRPRGENREMKVYRIPVSYDLMEPLAAFAYDTASEPITEEIVIRTLQIIQTRLQVVQIFQYETVSDEYYAKLEYGKPTMFPPEEFELRVYNKKDELVKIIEFKLEGSYFEGKYVPIRYWKPFNFSAFSPGLRSGSLLLYVMTA